MGQNNFLLLVYRENAAEEVPVAFSAILQNPHSHSGKNREENSRKEKRAQKVLVVKEDCTNKGSLSLGRQRLDRSFRIWQIVNRKDNDQLLPIVKERQKEPSITCSKDYIGHILIKKMEKRKLEQDTLGESFSRNS